MKNVRKIVVLCVCIAVTVTMLASTTPSFAAKKKPARVTLSNVSSKTEKMAVLKWKKVKCSAYQIQYSQYRNFKKSSKKVKVAKSKKTAKIKKLAAGKKYYFRIRGYLKYGKKIRYGKWSKVKVCTIHNHIYKLTKKTANYTYYECRCGKVYKKKLRKETTDQTIVKAKDEASVQNSDGSVEQTVDVKPSFSPSTSTKGKTPVDATGTNNRGFVYKYRLFSQSSSSLNKNGNNYMKKHGCSTCSLTTILRATVPELADYEPNKVLTEVIKKVAGTKTYNANFKKSIDKQMPISLKGMDKVLTEYGVNHKFVYTYTASSAQKTIKNHLSKGDPIIIFIAGGLYSNNPHAMLLLGLDKNGKVIVGESAVQKKRWGASAYGLVKYSKEGDPNSNTISNIVKYLDGSTKDISKNGFFYSGGKYGNRGFILINPTE